MSKRVSDIYFETVDDKGDWVAAYYDSDNTKWQMGYLQRMPVIGYYQTWVYGSDGLQNRGALQNDLAKAEEWFRDQSRGRLDYAVKVA